MSRRWEHWLIVPRYNHCALSKCNNWEPPANQLADSLVWKSNTTIRLPADIPSRRFFLYTSELSPREADQFLGSFQTRVDKPRDLRARFASTKHTTTEKWQEKTPTVTLHTCTIWVRTRTHLRNYSWISRFRCGADLLVSLRVWGQQFDTAVGHNTQQQLELSAERNNSNNQQREEAEK